MDTNDIIALTANSIKIEEF